MVTIVWQDQTSDTKHNFPTATEAIEWLRDILKGHEYVGDPITGTDDPRKMWDETAEAWDRYEDGGKQEIGDFFIFIDDIDADFYQLMENALIEGQEEKVDEEVHLDTEQTQTIIERLRFDDGGRQWEGRFVGITLFDGENLDVDFGYSSYTRIYNCHRRSIDADDSPWFVWLLPFGTSSELHRHLPDTELTCVLQTNGETREVTKVTISDADGETVAEWSDVRHGLWDFG